MKFHTCHFSDLFVIDPAVYGDQRGVFFESYNKNLFGKNNLNCDFVQDNVSVSKKNVLRGLHFQNPPFAQGKLVSVLQGAVLDVVVDIRLASATYGQHYAVELSAGNRKMMYVPVGFAHGFVTLEDNTIFSYKCTNGYNKSAEGGLLWNDPALKIDWLTENPILSDKDLELPCLSALKSLF
jgi:dTDP-4-dehydrorhamnose 3,5-epimerase